MWRHDVISFESLETVAMQGCFIKEIDWWLVRVTFVVVLAVCFKILGYGGDL